MPKGTSTSRGRSIGSSFPTTQNAFDAKFTAPLRVASNAGKTISPTQVGAASSVTVVGGTPDGTILYAATSNGILLSGDSGATWRPTLPLPVTSPATVYSIALDPFDPATILVATNRGLFGSDSGGQLGWGLRDTGLPVSGSGDVWATTSAFYSAGNPYIAYATSNNPSFLFESTDAEIRGRAGSYVSGRTTGADGPVSTGSRHAQPDGGILYAVNGNGTMFQSLDGEVTWVKLARGLWAGPGLVRLRSRWTRPMQTRSTCWMKRDCRRAWTEV